MSLARAFKIQMAGSLVQMFAQVFRGKLAAISSARPGSAGSTR